MVDTANVNPDLKEAWKVTKAGVTGTQMIAWHHVMLKLHPLGLARVFSMLQRNATTLLKTSADQTTHTVAHKWEQ